MTDVPKTQQDLPRRVPGPFGNVLTGNQDEEFSPRDLRPEKHIWDVDPALCLQCDITVPETETCHFFVLPAGNDGFST